MTDTMPSPRVDATRLADRGLPAINMGSEILKKLADDEGACA